MKRITEGAFAKLNLTLDVLDRRADGYHDIKSIMQTVSLHDDVLVDLGGEGWQVHCYRELLPPDADENTTPELVTCGLPQDRDNLAWKAAEAFYARTGLPREGLEIFISKRIPMQAGLGGGSADAAAVLRALNRAYDAPLSIPALCELGAQVGSDVPFCVMGGTALVEGKGELLTRLPPAPEFFVVICKPDFPISTPELFHRVDARTSRCRPDTEGICAALADGDMPRLARRMYNVFEDVLTHREGEIAAIKSRLLDGGALGAVMSGTGSAVFGIFADADSAAYAKRRLARDYAECFLTETIGRLEI